jgi:hypothetical protein
MRFQSSKSLRAFGEIVVDPESAHTGKRKPSQLRKVVHEKSARAVAFIKSFEAFVSALRSKGCTRYWKRLAGSRFWQSILKR